MSLRGQNGEPNITEIDLGSPDAVIPLNSREKELLKRSPSAALWNKALLDFLSRVKIISKTIEKRKDDWNGRVPYEVIFEYGWDRRLSVESWLVKARFRFHLSESGKLLLDSCEHEVRRGPAVVDQLADFGFSVAGRSYSGDRHDGYKVLSTVSTEIEAKTSACVRDSKARFASPWFEKVVRRWVSMTMREEMLAALKPLLQRYPADKLIDHLHSLVVEEVHNL